VTATIARHVEHCMGTVFSFDVRTPGVDGAVFADIVRFLHDVDERFSTYRPDSEISRVSRGELAVGQCHRDVVEILDRCAELEDETGGYFSAYADGTLDPSGLVKGWAIERASDLLVAAGSTSHCVNGGGDVQCVGESAPGVPWRVGIANPHRVGEILTVVAGRDIAVATSGTAERGAHILDPHTRRAPSGLASVTVVGRRLSDVDPYATAAFAMGLRARGWIDGLAGHWGFGVNDDGTTWTAGFESPARAGQVALAHLPLTRPAARRAAFPPSATIGGVQGP
jgi:FAD:protein FMN transferase